MGMKTNTNDGSSLSQLQRHTYDIEKLLDIYKHPSTETCVNFNACLTSRVPSNLQR